MPQTTFRASMIPGTRPQRPLTTNPAPGAALMPALLIVLPINPFLHFLSRLELGVSPFWNCD